ncbi:MAG: tail fiber domain-containing protein [Elusimicrobia bacterium]|nr:tail fiber domain-containing protein [Elusimicrobiota bacterium]
MTDVNLVLKDGGFGESNVREIKDADGGITNHRISSTKLGIDVSCNPASTLTVGGGVSIGSESVVAPTDGLYVHQRVGIGATSPSSQLHIYKGDLGDNYIIIDYQQNYSAGLQFNELGSVRAYIIWNDGSNKMIFKFGGNERVTFQEDGKVGIGTTVPTYKLDVNGDINVPTGSQYKINGVDQAFDKWTAGTGDNIYRSSGSVGIGTTSPAEKLHIYSTANAINKLLLQGTTDYGTEIRLKDSTQEWSISENVYVGSALCIRSITGSDTLMTFTASSKVGIGTTSPSRKLFVSGDAGGTTQWYNDSDSCLKENIKTIENALEKVIKLRGINFEWKDKENRPKGLQMGLIAQEVKEIVPEIVDKKNEHYSMATANLTALLVEAVKQLNSKVKELEEQLKNKQ